jgi:5'-methylthioadenosine phosphorylase
LVRIAVIGGSGLEELLGGSRRIRVDTPFGPAPEISIGQVGKDEVAFLPRHGPKHDLPPHKVNYRANLHALKQVGVERIIATNAVGGINTAYTPGDLAVPEDILDFTKNRIATFFDSAPVTHVDVSKPYCPELRKSLIESAEEQKARVWGNSILAATEGPRYETPAEIRMIRMLGGDIVGMTGAPEAFLARELEICYSTLCFISNRAAGQQEQLSAVEVMTIGSKVMPQMLNTIRTAIQKIPTHRSCTCARAINQAQV